jgi:hypothetical protein
MKSNFKKQDVVINLHERGFTNDFQLIGNDLLWVQGKTYLPKQDHSVLELYKFTRKDKSTIHSDVILGIQSLQHNAKGILIHHFTNKNSAGDLTGLKINRKKTIFSNRETAESNSNLYDDTI